ncbi:hypothetical protein TNCV_3822131 [Trichonephila clavipes]|nr:hypothetical protein TNCV_3822131 [Trichonephila clavipes]
MKIGNNGNLVLVPFDESTPCLMIVLMNCQTKLRINLLTAVKSVAILEMDNNKVGEGISSDKITKEVNLITVEGMTTIQRKPTESLTEKERTFPTGTKEKANSSFKHRAGKEDGQNIIKKHKHKKDAQVKSNERPKESCFGVSREERNPVLANIEKDEFRIEMLGICDKPTNVSFDKAAEGISHNNISRELNLASVDGITTIQRLETFSEKERSFPADTEKANSGLKHRVQKKEVKKKSKEHKVKKDSKELPINSNFLVSHEHSSSVAAIIDNNTAGEGIAHNNISTEVNLTSVDGTTTIQRIPPEIFNEKERSFPADTEKANSGLKHRFQKKEGKKSSKEQKVKKDSKELPMNASFVVSYEQSSPVAATIDNCTLDPNGNKEVNLTDVEQDNSCCMIIKEVNDVARETVSPCKIEKERKTPVQEETSIPSPDSKNTIEEERNLPNVSNVSITHKLK